MKLLIANKLHSSWSLRPWLLLTAFDIPFEEVLIPFGPTFDDPEWKAKVQRYSPAGKVPVLVDGDRTVWETTAIIDHVAETRPDLPIWPRDPVARAYARSIVAEMHAGFSALRNACPMNLGKVFSRKDRGPDVARDVARIEAIWREARERFGATAQPPGPFLFGDFSAADAMYAPVVTRFTTYSIPVAADTRAYMDAVLNHPAFKAWRDAAIQEPWIVPEDEVDETPLVNYRSGSDQP